MALQARGTADAVIQKQESAEHFRKPPTVLEIRVLKGQEWGV